MSRKERHFQGITYEIRNFSKNKDFVSESRFRGVPESRSKVGQKYRNLCLLTFRPTFRDPPKPTFGPAFDLLANFPVLWGPPGGQGQHKIIGHSAESTTLDQPHHKQFRD